VYYKMLRGGHPQLIVFFHFPPMGRVIACAPGKNHPHTQKAAGCAFQGGGLRLEFWEAPETPIGEAVAGDWEEGH